MSMIQPSSLLRSALSLDSLSCAVMGLLLSAFAGSLAGPLGLPGTLLRGAGVMLLPCAVLIGYLASRQHLPRWTVQLVIALNLLWVADSLAVITLGWFAPSGLGIAFVLVQAAAVGALAGLEALGLRRSGFAATRAA